MRLAGVWRELLGHHCIPARCSHTCNMIGNSLFLVGGGKVRGDDSSSFEHFGDVWRVDFEEKATRRLCIEGWEGRRGHSTVVYRGRYLVVFGGVKSGGNGQDELVNEVIVIDIIEEKRVNFIDDTYLCPSEVYVRPDRRKGHVAGIWGDTMIVLGGYREGDLLDMDQCFVYSLNLSPIDRNVATNMNDLDESAVDESYTNTGIRGRWRRDEIQGKMPIYFHNGGSVQTGSELLIFGGAYTAINPLSLVVSNELNQDLYVFDLITLEMSKVTRHVVDDQLDSSSSHLQPRFCTSLAVVNDAFLIIYGGSSGHGDSVKDTVVIYNEGIQRGVKDKDNNRQPWRTNPLRCMKLNIHDSSLPSPSPRNAMTLTSCGGDSPSLIMFGGGIFPDTYYNDMWALNIISSPISNLVKKTWNDQLLRNALQSPIDVYFSSCFGKERHADVVLILKGDDESDEPVTLLAHKIILAAKSAFFRSLFDGLWAENSNFSRSNVSVASDDNNKLMRVNLDVAITPFRHVLEFLYTNTMDVPIALSTLDMAVDVLQCATMLDLTECKAICEQEIAMQYLKFGVNNSAAVRCSYSSEELLSLEQEGAYILSIADTFHCEYLSLAALEQVRVCRNVLISTDGAVGHDHKNEIPSKSSSANIYDRDHMASLYSEYFESISPQSLARLKHVLEPSSVIYITMKKRNNSGTLCKTAVMKEKN